MRILATTIIILFMTLLPVQAELITTGSALDAELLYYQPVPAQPGDSVDVWIQVTNDGGTASRAGTVTIIDSGPFVVESTAEREKSFPQIPARESFLVKSKVRIDKAANEGENDLKVRVREMGSTDYIERNLPITITGKTSALSIVSASTDPSEVLPGGETVLSVAVQNVGDTTVRNVAVSLDLSDLSIVPLGSSDSKTVRDIRGGEEYVFEFPLVTYPDAEAQAYRIPIALGYDDEQGNSKSQNESVGIVVGSEPELLVYFDSVALTKEDPEGEVVIRIVNKGLAEIKLAELEVLPAENIEVTSQSSIVYVGNIDEDDYESAELTLRLEGESADLPVVLRYRDALNRPYEEERRLHVQLQQANGSGNGGIIAWAVIVALVAIGAWYIIRRRRRRK